MIPEGNSSVRSKHERIVESVGLKIDGGGGGGDFYEKETCSSENEIEIPTTSGMICS